VETLDPVKGLSIAVRIHVTWHCEQQKASFVGNSELRSLEPSLKQQVIATRDAHQLRFDRALRDGVDAGIFETNDVKLVSRAIVTMTTAVATWYRPDGLYSPAELAELYVALALRMAGVVGERPTV
jgi:hypothetical protein